jgi:PAS domain S-box-containing protein
MTDRPQHCSDFSSSLFPSPEQGTTGEKWYSQSFSQQILDSSDDCIKVLDLEGRLLFLSLGGQALLGIQDLTPLIGTLWIDFWQGADRQMAIQAIAAAKAGEVFTFQGYLPTLRDEPKWWEVKVSPIRGAERQVDRLLCISRDITQRRQNEIERKQAEERLAAIFSRAAVGLSEISLTGQFQSVNDELCRIVGRSRTDLLTAGFADITYPEDIAKSLAGFQNLIATGEAVSFDKRYVRPDGAIIWANSSLTRLDDEQGRPRAVLAVTVDLSDRLRIEADRQQNAAVARRAAKLDAFRISLTDTLRPLADPVEIQAIASRILGEYLGANRVLYYEAQDEEFVVERDYVNGVETTTGRYFMIAFGESVVSALRSGHSVISGDVAADSDLSVLEKSAYTAVEIAAHINIPLLKNGSFVAGLSVHSTTPRTWTQDEIALAEEAAERTWAAVERARAEADLRKSEEKYRTLFDSIDEGFAVCQMIFDEQGQPCDYRFLQVNPAFTKLTGLVEVVDKTALELLPTLDKEPWVEIYSKVVQTGEAVRFEQHSPVMNSWYDVNAFCVDEPQYHHFALLFSEISDRKRIEVALRESEAKNRNILESISDGFYALDENWRFTYANQAAEILTRRQASDLIGKVFWEEFPGVAGSEFEQVYRRAVSDRIPMSVTAFYPDHDCWYEVSAYPAANGITIYFKNVTALKQSEAEREQLLQREQAARQEAERANRIKDEFLAVLSHELRTPLNPILGWLKILQSGKLNPDKSKEALATIDRNAKLQAQLIEDLLDISRVLHGKLTLTRTPVDLAILLKNAIDTVRLAAEAKHIQIQMLTRCNMQQVSGDAVRLQQAIWNLLSNAIKFTPANGQIPIQLAQVESIAELTIRDTGRGISAEFLPHIFEHFRQEDGSTTRKFGGLGLGLAIVRQIIEMHGGTIRAESLGENQGATFIVQLPLMPQPRQTAARPTAESELRLDGIKILLVDDDTDTRDFQAFVLEQSGATVTAIASGSEALQTLAHWLPDVLVSDVGMPEMDGYELIQLIRSRASKLGSNLPAPASSVKAIALTAYAAEEDQQKAFQAGFQAHVTKPIDPDVLVQAIINLLG